MKLINKSKKVAIKTKVAKKVAVLEVASRLIIKDIAGILHLVKTILKTILKQNEKCTLEMHPKQNKKCPKQNNLRRI